MVHHAGTTRQRVTFGSINVIPIERQLVNTEAEIDDAPSSPLDGPDDAPSSPLEGPSEEEDTDDDDTPFDPYYMADDARGEATDIATPKPSSSVPPRPEWAADKDMYFWYAKEGRWKKRGGSKAKGKTSKGSSASSKSTGKSAGKNGKHKNDKTASGGKLGKNKTSQSKKGDKAKPIPDTHGNATAISVDLPGGCRFTNNRDKLCLRGSPKCHES